MATCRRLSPSIGIVRSTFQLRASIERDVLRPGVADQEPRAVGRERDPPRLAADGQPAGDLAGRSGRRGRPRCSRRRPHRPSCRRPTIATPRGSGPTSTRPATRDLVVLDLEHRQVVAIPVRDDAAAAVARERHARRLVAGLDLVRARGRTWCRPARPCRPSGWRSASRSPSAERARAIGERCGSSIPAPASEPTGLCRRRWQLATEAKTRCSRRNATPVRDKAARAESTRFFMKLAPAFRSVRAARRVRGGGAGLSSHRRLHPVDDIDSKQVEPEFKVRAVRSQSASRLSRRSADSALAPGTPRRTC